MIIYHGDWRELIVTLQTVLFGVVVDNRLRELMESLKSLDDRLFVVVSSAARHGSLQQSSLHRLIGNLNS